jgi:predicted nucleic acid-binding protein
MRIYLDSNVFISLFQTEIGKHKRGLFIEAEQFIEKVKENSHILVFSDWFFNELRAHHFTKEDVLNELKERKINFELVKSDKKTKINEFLKQGIHASDAFHIAIAIKEKCDCIVTFDLKDFSKAKNIIKIFEPKEFM